MPESPSAEAGRTPFESALETGRERFLAQVVVHALNDSWRTPDDFLRHFPPEEIIGSLAGNDGLRAKLLVKAAGVHERLALKKSVASGSEDLAIALSEGISDAAGVLQVYEPDDRVRHLDHAKLWAFATEEGFWKAEAGEPGHATGVARIGFIVERALEQELLTRRGIVEALTIPVIVERLPEKVARKVVAHALTIAEKPCPLDASAFFEVVPLTDLIRYIPLDFVWQKLVEAGVAAPNNLLAGDDAKARPAAAKQATPSKPPGTPSAPPPRAASVAVPADESEEDDDEVLDVTDDEAVMAVDEPSSPEAALSPAELEALNDAAEALRALERLPPSYETLSIPILRSIESMYADLPSATDDAERESVIRESFPNEGHLRKAMLALIELLDPSIDTAEPLIREADVDALIKIVLFEERRREEQRSDAGPSSRRGSRPPGPGSRRA